MPRIRSKAERLARTEVAGAASQDAHKRWAELERLVSVGVIAAYGVVSAILYAFRSTQAEPEAKPVLLARNAQAGAD